MTDQMWERAVASSLLVLRRNAELRERARSLRTHSQRSRERSRAEHTAMHASNLRQRRALSPPVSFGEFTATELVDLLVDFHDYQRTQAMRAVVLGLLMAGYPADSASVGAADAMEIVQGIVS